MNHTTTILHFLVLTLPFACFARDGYDQRDPNFVCDLHVPTGKVLFVGFDKGEANMIRLDGDISIEKAANRPAAGVDVVQCLTATSELALKVSAWWPERREEEKSWGAFKVETKWNNDRTEKDPSGSTITWIDRAGHGIGYRWRLSGIREYSEERHADGHRRWLWRQTEKYHPMRLERQNPGIAGLSYYRIPCAATENSTKGLVVFIADNIEMLSTRIRVSGKRHRFQWNRGSFPDNGKPKLQQDGADQPATGPESKPDSDSEPQPESDGRSQ